ncbi:Hpt domain-containing protein [Spirochaeta africana]|uniref:histidine kinase n=1 Tax=Spirochaeta africana (strain ATCC 700263 / DSM 8902 / Z-7692) TaxID=889378 RepID=H9UK71_SPIAZ|nr:Hpt domain-containing protein [Spirochaeta africana]AFG37914.1 chemotaxis protein histidine kinase-like protein [Spirochaeta africana DSM 8902]
MSNPRNTGSHGLLYNLLTSGTFDSYEISQRSRIIFLNTVIFVGVFTLTLFSAISFSNGNLPLGLSTTSVALVLIFGFIFIRLTHRFVVGDYIASQSIFLLYCYLYLSGGEQGSGVLWLFSYPLIALFLHRIRTGSLLSGLLFVIMLLGLFHPGIGSWDFQLQYGMRIIGSYLFIYIFGLIYEMVREATQRSLAETNTELSRIASELSQEKIQSDAIFKNVQEGIFVMDDQFRVLPTYSSFLESLLETDSIDGESLPDLIGGYLTPRNAESLRDYLPMLLNDSLNPDLIQDINPLEEVQLGIPVGDGDLRQKTLQFRFIPMKTGADQQQILTVVYDVTARAELAARMSAEQHRHQRDMETLFQVLHVDPQLMAEFIEDTEQELDSINALLRNKQLSIPETLTAIFQSMHSIKGNALLLGLEELGITLHHLEQHIKDIQELANPDWRDLLQLTADLGEIQQAIEDTSAIIQKLVTFQTASAEAGLSQAGLLERAIRRIAERESSLAGCPATISFFGFELLTDRLRRPIRDILIQLIRNSFAHGLESPEERQRVGKPETAVLQISLQKTGSALTLRYRDDGRGLDPDRIRAKATRLLPEKAGLPDTEIIRLVFHPRFSTAEDTDLSAGQGVGLAFVHARTAELGGHIRIYNKPGIGFQLVITVPG